MNTLSFDEVVQKLPGMTSSKLRRWIALKKVPFNYYKVGRDLSFNSADVESYIQRCIVKPEVTPQCDIIDIVENIIRSDLNYLVKLCKLTLPELYVVLRRLSMQMLDIQLMDQDKLYANDPLYIDLTQKRKRVLREIDNRMSNIDFSD